MYCPDCGSPVDENGMCTSCGLDVNAKNASGAARAPQTVAPAKKSDSGLRTVGFVFMIISMVYVVISAFSDPSTVTISINHYLVTYGAPTVASVIGGLIPLAWMIPMTVHANKIRTYQAPNTVAFGVCTLIFVNLIGGILLLCANKDR